MSSSPLPRYYPFGQAWVKESIEDNYLVRRTYTADPRADNQAKLDSIVEFKTTDPESSTRTGWVMGTGAVQWGSWEP